MSYVFAQESVQSGRGPLVFVIFHRFAQAFRQTFPLNLRKTHFASVGIEETSYQLSAISYQRERIRFGISQLKADG
jgi:hypothetical protein